MTYYEPERLKALGNLTYLDFMRVIQKMWSDAYPNIPFRAEGDYTEPVYPLVTYNLDARQPQDNEPKPRIRDELLGFGLGPNLEIKGQRFLNIIRFTVESKHSPQQAEAIIEMFEDFMLEFTPVFKQLGVADIFYQSRQHDADVTRVGPAIIKRYLTYRVTLEKLIFYYYPKIQAITAHMRTFLADSDEFHATHATPNYQLFSGDATPFQWFIEDQFGSET